MDKQKALDAQDAAFAAVLLSIFNVMRVGALGDRDDAIAKFEVAYRALLRDDGDARRVIDKNSVGA